MNITYLTTSYPPAVGGAQLHLHEIVRRMAVQHPVQVVTQWTENRTDWLLGTTLRAPETAITYELDGVPVQQLTLTLHERRMLLPWIMGYYAFQGAAIDRISEILADKLEPLVLKAAIIHNVRIGREPLSYAALKIARRLGVPFILTPLHHPRWGTWFHRHYHALYRQADALIALTEVEKRQLAAFGVDEGRIDVTGVGPVLAPNADPGRFLAEHNIRGPMVLFLGQKYRYKNFTLLLQAAPLVWHTYPDTHFVFIGPRTAYSHRVFKAYNDPRILELPIVTLNEKTDALAACDILCMPSTQESFGGVFVEAWSLGKPVIGGDAPAVREVIDEGVDGLVVSPNSALLAESITMLLSDAKLRTEMGEEGQRKVQSRFTWQVLASRTEMIYRLALSGKRL